MPSKLFKSIGHQISKPALKIFNSILKTGDWPPRWKVEEGIALKKVQIPASESDVIIMECILEFIGKKITGGNMGVGKGAQYAITSLNS